MNHQSNVTTKKIVFTALMAALTMAGSALRITIPVDIAGTTAFHLGNIMCALGGILLGPWYGALSAGLGSAIYDMMNPLYISEAWITFLTKAAYGLAAGAIIHFGKKPWTYGWAQAATLTGAVTYAILYLSKTCFYGGMLLGGLPFQAAVLTIVPKLPATVFNGVVAVLFAPVLAVSIRSALEKNRLSID